MPKEPIVYKVNTCGLMRCCLHSLDLAMQERVKESAILTCVEGEIIECSFCKEEMVFQEDVWKWTGVPFTEISLKISA